MKPSLNNFKLIFKYFFLVVNFDIKNRIRDMRRFRNSTISIMLQLLTKFVEKSRTEIFGGNLYKVSEKNGKFKPFDILKIVSGDRYMFRKSCWAKEK